MEKSNEEVTKKENKVKKFLKKNWPYLVGTGVIVVGGSVLGIKVKKDISKRGEDCRDIIRALYPDDKDKEWMSACLEHVKNRTCEMSGLPEDVDGDIFLVIAPALEEAVLNGGDKKINFETWYDLGDMHHRSIEVTVDSVFGD